MCHFRNLAISASQRALSAPPPHTTMSGGEKTDRTGLTERNFSPYDDDDGSSFQADFITPLAGHAPFESPHRRPGELPPLDTGRRATGDAGSVRSASSSPTVERTDSPTSINSDEGRGQRSAQGLQRSRIVYKSRAQSSTPVAARAMGGPSAASMRRYVSDSPVHEGLDNGSVQRSAPLDRPSTASAAPMMSRTLSAYAVPVHAAKRRAQCLAPRTVDAQPDKPRALAEPVFAANAVSPVSAGTHVGWP